jgi:hypothetical protein
MLALAAAAEESEVALLCVLVTAEASDATASEDR